MKSNVWHHLTTRVTVVECIRVPAFPLMVKRYVPVGVFGFVVIVNVVVPEPATEVGTNEEVTRAGRPLTRKLTEAENGPNAATDTVNVVLEFLPTV